MTASLGPISDTKALLSAEINNSSSSSLTMSTPNVVLADALSNGLQLSSPKQNGHTNSTNDEEVVHHSNGHLTENGKVFGSDVYVFILYSQNISVFIQIYFAYNLFKHLFKSYPKYSIFLVV